MRSTPPGWPEGVAPPDVPEWTSGAVAWLLDQCPADYRAYRVWHRHPGVLAWVTVQHLRAQLAGMRQSWREVRPALADQVPPESVDEVLDTLTREGLRLRAALRSAELVWEATQGVRYVPRL